VSANRLPLRRRAATTPQADDGTERRRKATPTKCRGGRKGAALAAQAIKAGLAQPATGRRASQGKQDQAGGRGGGPARDIPPHGGGKEKFPLVGDCGTLHSRCQTGRRTGAGTRAIRSHLPRRASLIQRHPAAPPSTRLTHRRQKSIIKSPRVCRWCHVPAVGDGYRSASGHTPLCLPKKRRTSLYKNIRSQKPQHVLPDKRNQDESPGCVETIPKRSC
jgi:hypothetical protein